MGSVFDRIFGWFGGSRKEEEPVAEEEYVAVQEEERAPGFRAMNTHMGRLMKLLTS